MTGSPFGLLRIGEKGPLVKISLSTLLALISISTVGVASICGGPIVGLGLGGILLPTMIGVWIATALEKKYGDTAAKQRESDDPN